MDGKFQDKKKYTHKRKKEENKTIKFKQNSSIFYTVFAFIIIFAEIFCVVLEYGLHFKKVCFNYDKSFPHEQILEPKLH